MDVKKRFELVKQNTAEIITEAELRELLAKKKNPRAYIGLAVTGPFHMAYFIPFGKMLDFAKSGIKNTVLIADIHAAMDDLKAPWEQLDLRAEYYRKCVELGFPWKQKPKFVKGSSYQLGGDYVRDVMKISTLATVKRATRAASEVCRLKNPKVSELIYPIMQAVDEEYLKVDIQLGGIDQRHILSFAREFLPKIGYKPRVEIMTPLVASLKGPGVKMSASLPETHVKIYDSAEAIERKISKAYCPAAELRENVIIDFCKYFIFPIKGKLKVERPKKYGGDVTYSNFEQLEKDFLAKKLHPADLKQAASKQLIQIFSKVRKYFEKHEDMLEDLGKEFVA